MSEPSSQSGGESPAPKKKPAKKIAGLRPRSGSALLSNPALSGAASVVARSVLGQGPTPVVDPDATGGTAPMVPAPSAAGIATEKETFSVELANTASTRPTTPHTEVGGANVTAAALEAGIPLREPEVEAASIAGEGDPAVIPLETPASDPAPPVQAPASVPSTSAAKSEGKGQRKRPAPRSAGRETKPEPLDTTELSDAHKALLSSWRDSRLDLKLRKKRWQTQPFRFAADLVESLSRRVAEDCKSSGKTLTAAQYVDAAMARHLPQTIEEQLDLAEDFLVSRDSDVGTGQQGSHRVSPEVYAIASELPNALRQEGHARTAVHVYSGALDRFLAELEESGPLGKANAPRK
ncbi:hypothetical protein [Streptomyces sp. NPDC087297]|uniref:hypothetical protein n=1 Tax=Streptomyces sp. NPDC087297 TaxID=3365778 RepID=UPI0038282762